MLALLSPLDFSPGLTNAFLPLDFSQLAFGAAALNIQIPLMLGNLVNVVAQYTREHAGNYLRDIRAPALKLLSLYGLQVRFLSRGPKDSRTQHKSEKECALGLWFTGVNY